MGSNKSFFNKYLFSNIKSLLYEQYLMSNTLRPTLQLHVLQNKVCIPCVLSIFIHIFFYTKDLTGMRHTLVPSTVVAHTVSPVQITSPPTMQTQSHTTKTVVTTHTTVPSTKVTAWITVQNPASTTTLPKPSTTTTLPRTHSTLPTTQVPITVCKLMTVSAHLY